MTYDFGQVVLVPFPFTDFSETKRRPAVVVSCLAYNRVRPDAVLMAITSQVREPAGLGEALIEDWEFSHLPKPSMLKPVPMTVFQDRIVRSLGVLSARDQEKVRSCMQEIVG